VPPGRGHLGPREMTGGPYGRGSARQGEGPGLAARPDGLALLLRLAALAARAEAELFARHADGAGRYAGRLAWRALCQGAALHYLDGKNGVKDFDVWSSCAALGDRPVPYRWRGRPISAPPGSAVIRVTRRLCLPARRSAQAVAARAARRRPGSRPARLPDGSPHRIGKGTGGQGDHPDRPGKRRRRTHLTLSGHATRTWRQGGTTGPR
jgi:hypothetical protein